ncbi:hypothetical protein [Shouchella shacheensis]|uniref:hypothetical protein n=1 Tax=Shouchella shacheensis TaxID=1649580 RepID=UPI0015D5B348|nr:hypothetical protein [Shouchella shacheensis]
MEKKTAHVLAHSHWDREWYQSFEEHRYDFIQLMNDLFDLFKANEPRGAVCS